MTGWGACGPGQGKMGGDGYRPAISMPSFLSSSE